MAELAAWAGALPRPTAILMVSAHWEAAPITLGPTDDGVPLVYDFYGFPERYYEARYPAPAAPALAARVRALLSDEPVAQHPARGLDHGAYVPLLVMYPQADVPVLQVSLPTLEPHRLLALGARLAPLRDEGVLLIGSGFLTHGLPFLRDFRTDAPPPAWSSEFDAWAAAALATGDLDALAGFREAPGGRYAHPSVEHFVPLFVTLGAGGAGRSRHAHRGLLPGPLEALRADRLSARPDSVARPAPPIDCVVAAQARVTTSRAWSRSSRQAEHTPKTSTA